MTLTLESMGYIYIDIKSQHTNSNKQSLSLSLSLSVSLCLSVCLSLSLSLSVSLCVSLSMRYTNIEFNSIHLYGIQVYR
jgi:hypothetical protein